MTGGSYSQEMMLLHSWIQTSPNIRLKISFDRCIQTFRNVCFHNTIIVLHFPQG